MGAEPNHPTQENAMQEQKHETRARKAKLAISYITCGTLMVVWSIVWLLYLTLDADISGSVYLASGVVFSGIAVVLIGMKVGEIGKEANVDETQAEGLKSPRITSTAKTDPSIVVDPVRGRSDIELDIHRTATG
jgi:hypothetical protein